jgi:hypothetical protein
MRRILFAGITVGAFLSLSVSPSMAFAAEPRPTHTNSASPAHASVQSQINTVLKQHPDARQTGANEVSFDQGHAVLAFAPAESGAGACRANEYCFYDDINFNAGTNTRVLHFNLCSGGSGTGNLTDYGFNDDASAWVNNTGWYITVYNDVNRGGGSLWTESPHSLVSFVGNANDKASSFGC